MNTQLVQSDRISENISKNTIVDASNRTSNASKEVLRFAVVTWFIIATLGQWIFAGYVMVFYGTATATGHIERWNNVLPRGYIAGDVAGNVVVGMHLLLAAIIILGGPLQIIPYVRKHARTFHRWNGRLYMTVAVIMSITGLVMVWTRGSVGGMTQHLSISFNAVLILICAVLSLRFAMKRDFARHQVWALRLFLVSNGVWFFRIGLMLWLFLFKKPVGFDPITFEGPFLTLLSLSQYCVPLAILELYLRAKTSSNTRLKLAVAALLFFITILMGIGIVAATLGVWIPRMMKL
jgi:hypothetical protein